MIESDYENIKNNLNRLSDKQLLVLEREIKNLKKNRNANHVITDEEFKFISYILFSSDSNEKNIVD